MSTQICLWDTMKIRWTVNWPNTFQLKSIPIHLTAHTQKHTSCCKPTSVMPCCLVQIMQQIQRQCWTKQSEYARYCDAFQYITFVGLLFVRVLSYFEYRRIQRCLSILWRAGTTCLGRNWMPIMVPTLQNWKVNKLGVKDSGALTVGIYCHIDGNLLPLLSLQQLSIFVLCKVVWVILAWLWSLQIVMLMPRNLSPLSTSTFLAPKSTLVTPKHK